MKVPLLLVEKIEFPKVLIETKENFDGEFEVDLLKLQFNFKGSKFLRNVGLSYPDDEMESPRTFIFSLAIKLKEEDQDEVTLPYNIEVKAKALMYYRSDKHQGEELFRAVRTTGYSILYGAIREMVSNITARGPHGMWVLPAADFRQASQFEAVEDERRRQEKIAAKEAKEKAESPRKPRKPRKPSTNKISKDKDSE